ncbi:hypothetical protein [Streptomyces chartreusis]|uniref:hypothetical protein n=1 Tax=Streptomyces chartreusis TaxID=1969 RepID=UPI0033F129FB
MTTLWRQVLVALNDDTLDDAERETIVARGAAPSSPYAVRPRESSRPPTRSWTSHSTSSTCSSPLSRPAQPCGNLGNPDGAEDVEPVVTTTMRLTPVIGGQRNGSETVPRPELEPIFTALAARWESDGRTVPGRADEEWAALARL